MEETIYVKVDESTLSEKKPVEIITEEVTYDYDFLKQQEISILKQRDDFVEARNKELSEVRNLIAKCEELGIKSKLAVAAIKEPIETLTATTKV